jgi:hypothetical protein
MTKTLQSLNLGDSNGVQPSPQDNFYNPPKFPFIKGNYSRFSLTKVVRRAHGAGNCILSPTLVIRP